MTVEIRPLKEWLVRRRTVNQCREVMMALRYDLDGAMAAGQLGLAWRTQEEMLGTGGQLYLAALGVAGSDGREDDRMDRLLRVLDVLARIDPALGAEAWRLWLRPVPPATQLPFEVDRTLRFLDQRLGVGGLSSRRESVLTWAADTRTLRAVGKQFGLAQSDDWYVAAQDAEAPDGDWYADVLASLDREGAA
jgi:hypothetical protein